MTRTLGLILVGWQAPSELIDHCWEGFWIHVSCKDTALQQHRHWAAEAERMEMECSTTPSCKMLNEISTLTAHFLSLCGKANVNEHKDHVNQTVVYLQIANYPGVQIPSTTPYRQLWWGSLDLHYPLRFKQTRPHARHLIQISSCTGTL